MTLSEFRSYLVSQQATVSSHSELLSDYQEVIDAIDNGEDVAAACAFVGMPYPVTGGGK